jgi:hypothetical protein
MDELSWIYGLSALCNFALAGLLWWIFTLEFKRKWNKDRDYFLIHGGNLTKLQQWKYKLPATIEPLDKE